MERLHRECPPGLSDGQQRALARFIRLYDGLAALVAGREPTVALDAVLERTGLHAWLAQAGRPAAEEIATLRTLAAQEGDVGALQHLLGEEEVAERRDAIRVSTVHAYKGQEAEAVFLAGLDDGLFPHRLCLEHGRAGLQQELRAFYVALTRPRTRLYLSAAGEPAAPAAAGCPSRFLALIPPALLQVA
jgi:DNA helicase-2/ATP-dependent DNA helicase PcrA